MAECVLVGGPSVCQDVLMNENDVLLGSVSEDSSNTVDSVKSGFFGLTGSEALCSKYQLNGVQLGSCPRLDGQVMGSDSVEFTAALKSICEEGHNCRKKRCADRYDSSESSDSGVATLSCTDCSGSSSGTSDITEPGSPFSSDSDEGSPAKMPPTAWRWADHFLPTGTGPAATTTSVKRNHHHQGKITEYFKAQLKPKCQSLAKLPLVFQEKACNESAAVNGVVSVPQYRKVLALELSPIQVTSVFRKPNSVPKSPPLPSAPDDGPKPESPPTVATACSTPAPSPPPCPADTDDVLPLSVSTSEQCTDKPALPSPILRTPSQIRFPARNGWKGHFLSDVICRWSGCDGTFSTTTALLEHLQAKHVNTQSLSETFVCLWTGCKVYDRASCSRSWLERHVLSHGGNKPFRCIVDGCGHRFSSQTMLERHVNQHFNQSESSNSSGSSSKRNLESTPSKLFRRNGKKLRYRRQPFSARMFDYMDTGIMEGVQHSLLAVTRRQTLGQLDCAAGNTVTVYSKVIGRRTETDGTTNVLLRWYPLNILRDEWVPQGQVQSSRQVSWSECQEWISPPLFRHRPSQRKRKQASTAPR